MELTEVAARPKSTVHERVIGDLVSEMSSWHQSAPPKTD